MARNTPPVTRIPAVKRTPIQSRVRWLRLLGACLGVAALAHACNSEPVPDPQPDLTVAVCEALRGSSNWTCAPEDVHLLTTPPGGLATQLQHAHAVVEAQRPQEPSDILTLHLKLSPDGQLLGIRELHNLTDTSAVTETSLTVRPPHLAWVVTDGSQVRSVQMADLRGVKLPAEWSAIDRWQRRLALLQSTGRLAGIEVNTYRLSEPASSVLLGFSDSALVVQTDQIRTELPTDGSAVRVGAEYVQPRPNRLARPGNLLTWTVDRVRAMPWFGDQSMQWLKAMAFFGLDQVEQFMGSVTGDDGSAELEEELGELRERPPIEYIDPETGWPPPPMEPLMKPLEGEGKWVSLKGDPFIAANAGAPSPFVLSFIRTDRKRVYSQIFVLTWDPRQVELHAVSGTVEPKSATGETGEGIIPRKPEIMSRLVGAFNGGFQARHGSFGMMAERVTYLPPKPWAATVAKLDDGSTGFGTWPNSLVIPNNLISFRQNLTPLVVDGVLNPYKRHWWGGTPEGWTDDSRTVRSGLCLTKQGFISYFYGNSIDAMHLGTAMQRAHCDYGVHLDMNAGHVGMEFYHAEPDDGFLQVGEPLEKLWQAQGEVPEMAGWHFLGRRMIKNVALMNFPRYIDRQQRDFFYLTLRDILPGENLRAEIEPPQKDEGIWSVRDLAQHGWPYAIARTSMRASPQVRAQLLKLDPKTLSLAASGTSAKQKVLDLAPTTRPIAQGRTLWFRDGRFAISSRIPSGPEGQAGAEAQALATGYAPGDPRARRVRAALGLTSGALLVYAQLEGSRPHDAELLRSILEKAGARELMLLDRPLALALGGHSGLSGNRVTLPDDAVSLIRAKPPSARRIFSDTPIVKPAVWAPAQRKRVVLAEPEAASAGDSPQQ